MLKEFFYFPKSDRKVMLTILIGAILIGGGLYLLSRQKTQSEWTDADTSLLQKTTIPSSYQRPTPYEKSHDKAHSELFSFDPNTADSTALLRLGLSPWQVRNIYKYRAKGGIYRRPQDFARLYGLTRKQYRELEPYIHIADDYLPAAPYAHSQAPAASVSRDTTRRYPAKLQAGQRIPLNTSDTTMLRRVPGIGSYYARQIETYRRRLGGFAHVSQLREIEGMPETALAYFETEGRPTQLLNLNQLSLDQLRRHPYINFYQARAITDYRRLRGPIRHLSDLQLLKEFTPESLQRLAPYVTF